VFAWGLWLGFGIGVAAGIVAMNVVNYLRYRLER